MNTKSLRIRLCGVLIHSLVWFTLAAQPNPYTEPDWRFAHPNADAMAGVHIDRLMNSTFIRALIGQLTGVVPTASIDHALSSVNDIGQIYLSVSGKDAVMLLIGPIKSVPPEWLKDGARWQRISPDAILMGTEASLAKAVQRIAQPPAGPPRFPDARMLARSSDFWITANPSSFAEAKSFGFTGVSIAMSLSDQFRAGVALKAASAAAAQQMVAGYRRTPPTVGVSSVTLDGSTIRFSYVIDQAEMSKQVSTLLSTPQARQFASLLGGMHPSAGAAAATPKPAPPRSGKVIIYGLDGGPKEVSLGSSK